VEILANYLNTGNVFVTFVPGAATTYARIQRTAFAEAVVATSPMTYGGLDSKAMASRNIEILP
jgi:hypothetical protein